MTSDCRIFTRLAKSGQKGGRAGGGSAEREICVTFQHLSSLQHTYNMDDSRELTNLSQDSIQMLTESQNGFGWKGT